MNQPKDLYTSAFNPLLITPTRPLPEQVAVIGAGTIGPDIGYYLKSALPGIKLVLLDVVEDALKNAETRLSGYVKKAVDRRKMTQEKAEAVTKNITYTLDYDQIRNCDLVIEAATENIPLKQKIFQTVEELVSEDALITSNTSSIPADRIFSKMKKPERTTITHFFAPAWRSLPVEVISWKGASQATVDYLFWFFASTGKAPIITANAVCFMLDRIFDNWCNEAAYLLEHASASQIDKVTEQFVFAGPFFHFWKLTGLVLALLISHIIALIYLARYFKQVIGLSPMDWWGLEIATIRQIAKLTKTIIASRFARSKIL